MLQWQILPFQALTIIGLGLEMNWLLLGSAQGFFFSLSLLSHLLFKGERTVPWMVGNLARVEVPACSPLWAGTLLAAF